MATTILIIEPSEANRKLLQDFIRKLYPDRSIELYDPVILGKPSPAFPWTDYDLVIMETRLDGQSGLNWMREFASTPDFPPFMFLSSDDAVDTVVQAMKLGASDYLSKKGLHYPRLKQAIDDILPPPVAGPDDIEATARIDEEADDFEDAQTQVLPEAQEAIKSAQDDAEGSGGYTSFDTQVLPESANLKAQSSVSAQAETEHASQGDATEDLHAIDHLPDVKPIPVQDDASSDATEVLPGPVAEQLYEDIDTVPTTQADEAEFESHLGDTQVLPQAKLTSLEAGHGAEKNNQAPDNKKKQEYWDENTEILFVEPENKN
jgi:DNA-binding NarL/FixJ family response regulator